MGDVIQLNATRSHGPEDPHRTSWVACKTCGYVFGLVRPDTDDDAGLLNDEGCCLECGSTGLMVVWDKFNLSTYCEPSLKREWLCAVEDDDENID